MGNKSCFESVLETSIIIGLILVLVLIGIAILMIISHYTTPLDEKFDSYHKRYAECIEANISISACEFAALDYAELISEPYTYRN